jgi:uncharacterized membrane protein YqjE
MTSGGRLSGLLASLRSAAGTGLDFVHSRIQLFGVELEQELLRTRSLIIQGVTALLLAVLAAGFVGIALIVMYWDTHRELVAVLVAVFFALLAAAAGVLFKRSLDLKPRPFNSTLEVLERDGDALRVDR